LRNQLSGLTNNLIHAGMSTADASHQALARMYLTVQTQASTEGLSRHAQNSRDHLPVHAANHAVTQRQ
jgi:hypothetical protein